MNIVDRFVEYAKIDTQSDDKSETTPSTKKQLDLANLLIKQLKEMNIDATLDEKGYIYASIPSNIDKEVKKVGFVAHMDTALEVSGKDVNPQFVDYEGGDIKLSDKYSILESENPFLKDLIGEKLITTDGNTLLGADDKSGIAIIMDMAEKIINSDMPHGEIKIGFTPDEEIGRGADFFDVEKFGADFAYTLDGGPVGELEFENFNAASANININGKNVHPGSAKNVM
ncbi:MAG: tripeptide aminopeptidase PepT, partial [Tissierellia bacterium]|nr:tripeptide aminopeptidase PepT [Tissierellia bacterium]